MDTAQARQWCRQQKYDQAAAMYARQIAAMDAWGPWDYYYYAYSLSKLKEYAEGREISRRCIIAFPGFTQIRDVYGWCLYHLYVRPFIPGQSAAGSVPSKYDSCHSPRLVSLSLCACL